METRRTHSVLAWVVVATLLLAGCGGSEGQQRKAFAEFLQTRILDRPGVHVPRLSEDEQARFGPYADDYAIITAFNEAMDKSVSPKLSAAVSGGSIRSLSDVLTHRDRLEAARTGVGAMNRALSEALAEADTARGELDQPADLKPVYDKAFERLVTQPATAFKSIVPVMDRVLGEAIDLGAYIDAHRANVRISGPMVETRDPAIQAAINDKLQSLQSNQQAVQAAQARMQSVVYGGSR